MSTPLPVRANLEYLKKKCKERVKSLRAAGAPARLASVQRDLAREYGFPSWRKLQAAVHMLAAQRTAESVPGADEFLQAAAEGNMERIRQMAAAAPALVGATGKHPTWGGRPQALHVAVERDQGAVLEFLLGAGADPSGDNQAYDGWSPLMLAIHWNRSAMRDALLAAGARRGLIESLMLEDDAGVERMLAQTPAVLQQPMPNAATPLHFARTERAVELLLASGADPAAKDKYGKTPMDTAVARGAKAAIDALRRAGATINPVALAAGGDLAGLQAALRSDPQVLTRPGIGSIAVETPAHAAAGAGQVEVLRWILAQGVPVNLRVAHGVTPLHSAAWGGQLETARLLVESGAEVTARDDEHGTTPAEWARTAERMFRREGCGKVAEFLEGPHAGGAAGASKEDMLTVFLELAVESTNLAHRSAEGARAMLKDRPAFATGNIYASAATGSASAVREWLEKNSKLAQTAGGARNWVPLLYVCYSLLLKEEKSKRKRAEFAACVRLLLEAGADANAFFVNSQDQVKESALYGASGRVRDAGLTRLLLEAGASVDDGESLYHACETADHACLKLLLERKPRNISYCMCHKMDSEDAAGVKLFLEHGADPNVLLMEGAGEIRGLRPLHFAILRGRSAKVLRTLIAGGANPALTSSAGVTPFAFAMRLGRRDLAAELKKHGASEELPPRDQFLAACSAGNGKLARRLLAQDPAWLRDLSAQDAGLLPHAAAEGRLKAVKLMVELGFPIDAAGNWGGSAIHQAAWAGHTPVVKFLLARGARLDARQSFGGDVMQTALHGAQHGGHKRGPEIVRLLLTRIAPADVPAYLKQATEQGNAAVLPLLERAAQGHPSAGPHKSARPATHAATGGTESFALIERHVPEARAEGTRWEESLSGERLIARDLEIHMRNAAAPGHFRRITVWGTVDSGARATPDASRPVPFDALEKFHGTYADAPTNGQWQRIATPGLADEPTVEAALQWLRERRPAGEFRVITVMRLFNTSASGKRIVVRAGHVRNPDAGQTPSLGVVHTKPAAADPFIASLPAHRRTHKIAAWKPLMDAAFTGDVARVKRLLAAGTDPNVVSTTPARYRPLHRAMEHKKTQERGAAHENVVRTLLAAGADPHLRGGWDHLTALGIAAIGEPRFIALLRARSEPLDIFHAAALGEATLVAAHLKEDPDLARAKDASGWTALHYATNSALSRPAHGIDACAGLLQCARLLIDGGADLAASYLFDNQWPIPVMHGCCGRHDFPEMAELLFQRGATACDHESVYHAADEGHAGALAMIEKRTPPKALAKECSFCLPIMLHWGHTRGLPWLLAHGGDANALSDTWGNSALHEAAARGSAEKIIGLLLKFGADPARPNKAGKTASELARAAGYERIEKQLKQEGAF